jgi:hypothetical protein
MRAWNFAWIKILKITLIQAILMTREKRRVSVFQSSTMETFILVSTLRVKLMALERFWSAVAALIGVNSNNPSWTDMYRLYTPTKL